MRAADFIQQLNLVPHPEGGFFRETYRSPLMLADVEGFAGKRAASTCIYFMLTAGKRSHLHRIKSAEIWHFYSGDPLRIVMLSPEGEFSESILGRNLTAGESFQVIVPAGYWFGAEILGEGEYSLVGCTVAPGFDFADFELANFDELMERFPEQAALLQRFCLMDEAD